MRFRKKFDAIIDFGIEKAFDEAMRCGNRGSQNQHGEYEAEHVNWWENECAERYKSRAGTGMREAKWMAMEIEYHHALKKCEAVIRDAGREAE